MNLGELRLQAKQRADMVHSGFITDPEWTSYINGSLGELHDLLVSKYGEDYYAADHSFATDGSTSYDLPDDFLKLLGVDLSFSGRTYTLKPFSFSERNKYQPATTPTYAGAATRYRLVGNSIRFSPTLPAGYPVTLWYVPRVATLVEDTDTPDVTPAWLEYVVIDSALKAKQKEETDVSVLLTQKAALIQRIETAASNRDVGMPHVVADVTGATGVRALDPYSEWGAR